MELLRLQQEIDEMSDSDSNDDSPNSRNKAVEAMYEEEAKYS